MPSKFQFYSQMAEQAAKQITGSYQSWISFLHTAGQLLYGVSVTIHSRDFAAMSTQEKRSCLLAFVRKVLS